MPQSIGPLLRKYWQTLAPLPGGRWLFSRVLGLIAPYTGTLRATVLALEPGYCEVTLRERRRVSNHLHSTHAMALANLAEMASGLALLNGLPAGARGILIGFDIEYLKKSRGQLTARCRCAVPQDSREQKYRIAVEIHDHTGELTTIAHAHWLIGPERHPDGK